jgi:peptide/nickel transport system permease protein
MSSAPPPPPPAARAGRRPNPRIAQFKRTWYFLRRNTLSLVGLGILLTIIVIALIALTLPIPWSNMAPYCTGGTHYPGCTYICTYTGGRAPGPNCYLTNPAFPSFIPPTVSVSSASLGPLPLGSLAQTPTVTQFYNVIAGLLRGSDWSLIIAFSIVASGALIGLLVGSIAGFWGGAVDETLMRLVDIFLSIPQILFVIITVTVFTTFQIPGMSLLSSRIVLLILAFIVTWWPFYARIVRGQVLVVREQKYVEAARASGAKKGRIVTRHVIPNSVYPVFIQMSLDVGTIPLLVGALAYLGFNLFGLSTIQVFPEWGSVAAYSVSQFDGVLEACIVGGCVLPWWQILFPGLALFLFAISVNFFSDGLRDALDPRLRR